MRIDELPRSQKIEDRRAVRRRAGGIGVGTLIILGLIGWAFGINPLYLVGGAEILSRIWPSQPPAYSETTDKAGGPSDPMKEFVSAVLGSAEVQWSELFAQSNARYQAPTLWSDAKRVQASRGGSIQFRFEKSSR